MNEGLKSVVDLGLAVSKGVVDVVEKKGLASVISDLEAAGMDVPAVIASAGSIPAEVKSLSDPADLADMVAYLGSKAVALANDDHAKAIVAASVKLVEDLASDIPALIAAVKGPAPAPAAA